MISTLFCLDFDETLMNTDRLRADLLKAIRGLGKEELAATYTEAYETTRKEHGVPRVPLILKRIAELPEVSAEVHSQLADIFHSFAYQEYTYPGAEQTIAYLKECGKVIIFSDGDALFQPQKVHATTVAPMVDAVIILPSKINYFADLSGYWPADKYVFIDDKQKVLNAAKNYFGEQATTVLVKQGRYADSIEKSNADITVDSIAEVADIFPLSRQV